MSVFSSESEMQAWLSEELAKIAGLGDLICDKDWLKNFKPKNLAETRVLASFKTGISSLFLTMTLFENENISLSNQDILKPDFVLYAPETESIVIVELKNLVSPSRHAGTELGAYSAEIRTCIPFLADGDVIHVLISSVWPALLKHYVRHEIFWQGRKLLCLRPIELSDGSKRLEILPLSELVEDHAAFQIGKDHLGGYNISLCDDNLYNPDADRERLTTALEVFRVALQAMAVTGNRLNSHGFAFLWKDKWQQSLAPYSIVVANFAPFQYLERFVGVDDISEVIERFIKIVSKYGPIGHGNTLNEITDACVDIVGRVCTPRYEGFITWGALSESIRARTEYLAFIGWGLFGEAAVDEVKERHRAGELTCSLNSPEVGLAVLDKLIDENYEVLDLSYYFYEPDEDDLEFSG